MSTQIDAYPLESPTNGAAAIGLNSSGVTRRLSMGTAAAADLTTSPTDTTAGRVMRVDDYPSDSSMTEVTSLDNGWTGTVRYIKRAGMVTITADLTGTGATGDSILTLPSNYRPPNTVTSTGRGTTLTFATSGGLVGASGRDPNVDFTLTYPVIT